MIVKKFAEKSYFILGKAAVFAVLLLFLLARQQASFRAFADDSYRTTTFNVDISASEDNSFYVNETIDVNFTYPHHGIYRYIPQNGIRVTDISVPGYKFDVSTRDGHKVIKIGDGDASLDGPQTYEIGYKMAFYDDEDESLDRLALNVIPTGWETHPVDHQAMTAGAEEDSQVADTPAAEAAEEAAPGKRRTITQTNRKHNKTGHRRGVRFTLVHPDEF